MNATGQIETCRACGISFAMIPDESTVELVGRYTEWRETHRAFVLAAPDSPPTPVSQPFTPDRAVHPGEILAELLDDLNLTPNLAATALIWPAEWINQVAISRHDITPEMAARLGSVFGPSSGFWLRLQARYTEQRSQPAPPVVTGPEPSRIRLPRRRRGAHASQPTTAGQEPAAGPNPVSEHASGDLVVVAGRSGGERTG